MTEASKTPLPAANDNREPDTQTAQQSMGRDNDLTTPNNRTPSSHRNSREFEDESKVDIEKLAASRDSSGSISPCPSGHDDDSDDRIVIGFEENDKSNPYNWSISKKIHVILTGIILVLNSTMGSALPSGTTETIERDFDIQNSEFLVLPVSIYLIGYILGPMVFAPLSESYGRKNVMISRSYTLESAYHGRCFHRVGLI